MVLSLSLSSSLWEPITDGRIQGLATTRKDWIPQQHCNDNRRSIFLPSFLPSSPPSFLLFLVYIFLLLFPFVFFILMIVCLKQIHWVKQRYSRWMGFIWSTEERTRGNSTTSFNHSWRPCRRGKDSNQVSSSPLFSPPTPLLFSSLHSSSLLTFLFLLSLSLLFLLQEVRHVMSVNVMQMILFVDIFDIICWQTYFSFFFLFGRGMKEGEKGRRGVRGVRGGEGRSSEAEEEKGRGDKGRRNWWVGWRRA